jgi:hypothetical protein
MKNIILIHMTHFSLVDVFDHEDGGSTFLENVDKFVPDYLPE